MNCQEALNLLYDIIDNEASDIDKQQVRDHLAKCCDCAGIYRIEESLQRFLSEKLKEADQVHSPALENLRDKIRKELYRQDAGRVEVRRSTPTRLVARTMAIAAAVVLMLSATYFAAGFYEHYRDYHDLEAAYLESLDDSARFTSPAGMVSARAFAKDSLAINVSPTVANFALMGAALTKVGEVTSGQFLYRSGSDYVSLFVCRGCDMEIPASTVVDDQGFCIHDCHDCHLCYRTVGPVLLVVAAANAEIDLRRFITEQRSSLAAAF